MSRRNLTVNDVVINCPDNLLQQYVLASYEKIGRRYLTNLSLAESEVERITSKTFPAAIFAKLAYRYYGENCELHVDRSYLNAICAVICDRSRYDNNVHRKITGNLVPYVKTYGDALLAGFSVVFLDLHNQGVLTLPWAFKWPQRLNGSGLKSSSVGELILNDEIPELLQLTRAGYQPDHPIFKSFSYQQRTRVVSICSRMLLALGWRTPSDANYEDLLALSDFRDEINSETLNPRLLINILEQAYGDLLPINAKEWRRALELRRTEIRVEEHKALVDQSIATAVSAAESVDPQNVSYQWEPRNASPSVAKKVFADSDRFVYSNWIALEQSYIHSRKKLESKRALEKSLAWLNIYLFIYLPAWFARNPECKYKYPSTPNKLLSAVFITDLGLTRNESRPLTFLDWFNQLAEVRAWTSDGWYNNLKQIEFFFKYVERRGTHFVDADSFKQPLTADDYPYNPRASFSNKQPIPRGIFTFYLCYIEAITLYFERLLTLSLEEVISVDDRNRLFGRGVNVIDTVGMANVVGMLPVVLYKGKWYPLERIPQVAGLGYWPLADGRTLPIPELHGIYHTYVALHTGIRHQHVQWLDARTFDHDAGTSAKREFGHLYLNTDKVKTKPWIATVSMLVIATLRKQLAWRNLIDCEGFGRLLHYEGHPESKWERIQPLFSKQRNGEPLSDADYTSVWNAVLLHVNCFLIGRGENYKLGRFAPQGVPIDIGEAEFFKRCEQATASNRGASAPWTKILFKSAITPHSSRTSVVTHLSTYLPADIIGLYITGQSAGTVYYYNLPQPDELLLEATLQAKSLRTEFYNQDPHANNSGATRKPSRFVKADDVNSALAKGMRSNVEAAIVSFGCVSVSVLNIAETGLDVLKRTRFRGSATNKTEICPYGNVCPQDIIILLKGIQKCALCPYAVRAIDHLPAVTAKQRQVMERLEVIEASLNDPTIATRYSNTELDSVLTERSNLAEEMTSWRLVQEVLENGRQRLAATDGTQQWVVGRPEVIEQDLRMVAFPSVDTDYILARLTECLAFPSLESPLIRSKFDMLRRQILANSGNIRQALAPVIPVNPAAECAGLIRSVMATHKLTLDDLIAIVTTDSHLSLAPNRQFLLSPVGES